MEEGVYGEGTGGETLEIVLVVQAGRYSNYQSASKSVTNIDYEVGGGSLTLRISGPIQ